MTRPIPSLVRRTGSPAASADRCCSALWRPAAALALVAWTAAGCGKASTPGASRADDARTVWPLPACVAPMPSLATSSPGVFRPMREQDYWGLVYPSFDSARRSLPANARTCTGSALVSPAAGDEDPQPHTMGDQDTLLGSGAAGLKLVWLVSRRGEEEDAGALAIVRARDGNAELYAVGMHRGDAARSRLAIERVGHELVALVVQDGCQAAAEHDCATTAEAYLARQGRLVRAASFDLRRTETKAYREPGVLGAVRCQLHAAALFAADGVRLMERVVVKDEQGAPVRRGEQERLLRVEGDRLIPNEPSLWERFADALPEP